MNHLSDCAVHNEPAYENEKCNCVINLLPTEEELQNEIEEYKGSVTNYSSFKEGFEYCLEFVIETILKKASER